MKSIWKRKTYIVLRPWRSWCRSLQFLALAVSELRCRAGVEVEWGPGPGLGVREAEEEEGRPRRESSTSSKVVEPGLGFCSDPDDFQSFILTINKLPIFSTFSARIRSYTRDRTCFSGCLRETCSECCIFRYTLLSCFGG